MTHVWMSHITRMNESCHTSTTMSDSDEPSTKTSSTRMSRHTPFFFWTWVIFFFFPIPTAFQFLALWLLHIFYKTCVRKTAMQETPIFFAGGIFFFGLNWFFLTPFIILFDSRDVFFDMGFLSVVELLCRLCLVLVLFFHQVMFFSTQLMFFRQEWLVFRHECVVFSGASVTSLSGVGAFFVICVFIWFFVYMSMCAVHQNMHQQQTEMKWDYFMYLWDCFLYLCVCIWCVKTPRCQHMW